ncbi:cupin domain-containing protein [Siccirubricoccus sp. KC 17139]|uniref:Cupin domain-containing protein n=1 Tax=Siccirubricoccus soli TaxID=2899147 RepID=A0ABT1DBA0_9PROT|nr:cupin domain-containing protein [Siccirubricoccus soli]MCO6419211.1 cupin domain-containing protein [Siccirubricoccus soli]MCP2685346.1 cupin domain-containing protein [Siccirubricoccus soli]
MLTRRVFTSCAICGVLGLTASKVSAQPAGGITRTLLRQEDVPGTNYVNMQMIVEIEPNAMIARHTHPGHEGSYVIEGESELLVAGQPPRLIKAGDSFLVPAGVPHAARNGAAKTRIFGSFVVEKGKPVASPAPE